MNVIGQHNRRIDIKRHFGEHIGQRLARNR